MKLEFLKKQRLEKGMTILEVSKKLGYSTANGYWKVETGTVKLTLETFIKLIEILELDINIALKEIY
ncbi:Helix-turn-helix domain [uncultured Clostridium sp.]|uniref:helix-turn-helix domain-containing protein n=1 Tax=uncultured Clostridium sp. TaxID=59620 RepID=UPI000820D7EF|nr:helix-turn-helix transcriptional regulator [uncultured Clostridium sp.]SCK01426.1 Helix-turn-helix domain [uncultured Clostridium sp.]